MKYIRKEYFVCKNCHEAFDPDDFEYYGTCPKCDYFEEDAFGDYSWWFKYTREGVFPV